MEEGAAVVPGMWVEICNHFLHTGLAALTGWLVANLTEQYAKLQEHTIVSASMNTHFEYCVSSQQWSLVNVTPSSGLFNSAR